MAFVRCRRDPCGVICLILTYFSVFYADYVVIQYVLLPAFSDSVWSSLHGAVFNLVLMLLLACHARAVLADPGVASLYSMVLVVSAWVWRIRNERDGDADKEAEETPGKHLIVAHYIILLVESVLFGVFVMVIFYDQLVSIITDETPIEQMKNRLMMKERGSSSSSSSPPAPPPPTHTRKPKLALLREVFGRGSVLCWLLPLHSSPPSVGGITYSALPDYDV
ncbi:Palmitoyltransferase ZDHHC3 [Liparis tanakae]|uniref:Palmitoyltransferase ZDHHC3 n=1 Tax=Liparis tanakae TaxID=230148 RepID=A0A4Z2F4J5_9TELE|nr:Palmitoyltransferase ZDHHC3 [Liparis tanakae]